MRRHLSALFARIELCCLQWEFTTEGGVEKLSEDIERGKENCEKDVRVPKKGRLKVNGRKEGMIKKMDERDGERQNNREVVNKDGGCRKWSEKG